MARNWLAFTRNSLPIVTITIENESVSALVDTGAQVSMISPTLATRHNLPQLGKRSMIGATGVAEHVETTMIKNLQIGSLKIESLDGMVVNIGRLGWDISLILGVNAFVNRKIQFNFNEGRIYLLD